MLEWLTKIPNLLNAIGKIIGFFIGRVEIRLDRDPGYTYFYTPDASGNRYIDIEHIDIYPSYTIFNFRFIISSMYDINIHQIDAYVYSRLKGAWLQLEDRLFYPPREKYISEYLKEFSKAHPPFNECKVQKSNTVVFEVPKIGCFVNAGLAHGSIIWQEYYHSEILLVIHVNTSFLVITCIIPEMNASNIGDANIVGQPVVYTEDNRDLFFQIATGNIENMKILARNARAKIWNKIR